MAKSKVIDGFSYEFDSLGKIIAVFDHSDPTNPTPVNPKSKLYADQVRSNDALTAFNFNRYGGNKDSYEKSVELVPAQVANDFYDKEVKDNKERLEEQTMQAFQTQVLHQALQALMHLIKEAKGQEFPMSYLHILLILILNKIILKYQDMNMREMTQNQIQALKDLNLLMLKL